MSDRQKLFGTDGIRGEAGRYPLDDATAFALGRAVAAIGVADHRDPRVVIGRDTRMSGPGLEAAIKAGVIAGGGVPLLLGILPTPGVAFMTRLLGAGTGLVISASHNPYGDNGIKVFSGEGFKLSDEQEQRIEIAVLGKPGASDAEMPPQAVNVEAMSDAVERYVAFLKATVPGSRPLTGLRIALDMANGATSAVAPAVFSGLGADVTVIHDRPDGTNINEGCGSEHTEDLRRVVVREGADMGLAFDGDGDRLVAVDEKGTELTGDQTLFICAQRLRQEGRLRNDQIVSTIMSNIGLTVACTRAGLKNHASDVGDRYVVADMQRLGAVLGGEPSGHMVFLDRHTTGDGILSGIELVAAVVGSGRPLSSLSESMEVFPQVLVNVEVKQKRELGSVRELADAIAEVESDLGDQGRVLVRYSGTQHLCRVMVEGPTSALAAKHASRLAQVVKDALG